MTDNASLFVNTLKHLGINFFAGVPCSTLKEVIDELINDDSVVYVSSTREDEAIGIASGAYLAGKMPAVLMQNSGLGNSLNVLFSHNLIYKIPCLILMGWRGYKPRDAPEHLITGKVNRALLDVAGVSFFVLERYNIEKVTTEALSLMKEKTLPVSILIKSGVFG